MRWADSSRLVTASTDNCLKLWSLDQAAASVDAPAPATPPALRTFKGALLASLVSLATSSSWFDSGRSSLRQQSRSLHVRKVQPVVHAAARLALSLQTDRQCCMQGTQTSATLWASAAAPTATWPAGARMMRCTCTTAAWVCPSRSTASLLPPLWACRAPRRPPPAQHLLALSAGAMLGTT